MAGFAPRLLGADAMKSLVTLRTARLRWVGAAKALAPPVLWNGLFRALVVKDIPDAALYAPTYMPWRAPWFTELYARLSPHTQVSVDRCWTIWQTAAQALHVDGDVMEAGVFQGGTAVLLREAMRSFPSKTLLLFDSFEGMQRVSGVDRHDRNDFADTSLHAVRSLVGDDARVHFYKGWVPDTFAGLEDRRFCFAHIDLDLYESVCDTLAFVYPRLSAGGVVVFDDYGFASCPGARKAVDEFFADRPEKPLALLTGQALVTKL